MTGLGARVASLALEKLLEKAERAWAREVERQCTLVFSESSFPQYLALPSRTEKDAAHSGLRNAERAGAIRLEWDAKAGEDGQISRVLMVSAELTAKALGRPPLWEVYAGAESKLKEWQEWPHVQRALTRWRQAKPVRTLESHQVDQVVDACKVLEACRLLSPDEEITVRRLSAGLFADSKRIEAIGKALDALTGC